MPTLYEQLIVVTKRPFKPGEDDYADFARESQKRVDKLDDADWKALKDPLQCWVNRVTEVHEIQAKGGEAKLPELEGLPELEASEGAEPAEDVNIDPETGEVLETEAVEANPTEETPVEDEGTSEESAEAAPARKPKAKGKAAKPAKAPKAAKPAKAAKGNGSTARGRPSNFAENDKIKVLLKENPHRVGTKNFKSFAKYKTGMTVAEAVKAGIPRSNIRYISGLEYIKVG